MDLGVYIDFSRHCEMRTHHIYIQEETEKSNKHHEEFKQGSNVINLLRHIILRQDIFHYSNHHFWIDAYLTL